MEASAQDLNYPRCIFLHILDLNSYCCEFCDLILAAYICIFQDFRCIFSKNVLHVSWLNFAHAYLCYVTLWVIMWIESEKVRECECSYLLLWLFFSFWGHIEVEGGRRWSGGCWEWEWALVPWPLYTGAVPMFEEQLQTSSWLSLSLTFKISTTTRSQTLVTPHTKFKLPHSQTPDEVYSLSSQSHVTSYWVITINRNISSTRKTNNNRGWAIGISQFTFRL
jgi:hypothetical protein